jgi:L-threonylcarbamoyladenylate synthase
MKRLKQENFLQKNILTSKLEDVVNALKENKITVFPTDTLYGILANALDKNIVEKVYKIKKRNPEKPYLILVSSINQINIFNPFISEKEKKVLEHGGITVVLKLKEPDRWSYLHRGTESLAFRIPKNGLILQILKEVNIPLIAPSANPEGLSPAKDVQEAFNYFKDSIDLYFDGGTIENTKPSTIIKFEDENLIILREGTVSREEILKIIE